MFEGDRVGVPLWKAESIEVGVDVGVEVD